MCGILSTEAYLFSCGGKTVLDIESRLQLLRTLFFSNHSGTIDRIAPLRGTKLRAMSRAFNLSFARKCFR
jgi:hypothetical protein